MTGPSPKLNAEGWEVTPSASNEVKPPAMISVPEGEFLMGTSSEDITLLQLKESDWAYEWSDNDLFVAEQPQFRMSLPAFEIAKYLVTNAEYHSFIWDVGHRLAPRLDRLYLSRRHRKPSGCRRVQNRCRGLH